MCIYYLEKLRAQYCFLDILNQFIDTSVSESNTSCHRHSFNTLTLYLPYDLERLADFECPLELLLPERERERDLE